MHKKAWARATYRGFTIVEIIIIITVIAVLATVSVVTYRGIQQRASENAMQSDLGNAAVVLEEYALNNAGAFPDTGHLLGAYSGSKDITLTVYGKNENQPIGPLYVGLTPVQHGVLLHSICEELIADPDFTTIHGKDGTTATVQTGCNHNIAASSLQITAWESKTWATPLERAHITNYMATVPADSWWVDRQAVVRDFYQELIDRFEVRGGLWPITSFWDPWANQWSGVPYEPLPPLDDPATPPPLGDAAQYCIDAFHARYQESRFRITSDNLTPTSGSCAELS